MNNPIGNLLFSGIQNGPMRTLMGLKEFFNTGNPAQAVQACLGNGAINQQQADMLMNAINNGNAEQLVRSMLASGQMTQEQFNTMSLMAQQFQTLFK